MTFLAFPLPESVKTVLTFVSVGILGYFAINLLGSGAAIIAYMTAEILKQPPIYKTLLSMMVLKVADDDETQTFFEARIGPLSTLVGTRLCDLSLPEGTLIVTIIRQGTHLVPKGNSVLMAGDDLYVATRKDHLGDVKIALGGDHLRANRINKFE